MKFLMDSVKRRLKFYIATFPIFGRNEYLRMKQRLDRQISIRSVKRQKDKREDYKRQLFPGYDNSKIMPNNFFDNINQFC